MKRREFLKKTTAAGSMMALPNIIPISALGRNGYLPPSDRITMVAIGTGARGKNNLKALLVKKEIQVIAICDVDQNHLSQTLTAINGYYGNKDCQTFIDYRELLDKVDADTATIAVPDHWHMLMYIEAAEKKMDIFGEKPLVRRIEEGKKVVEACKRNNIIWQTGSWQRSVEKFRNACELVANGAIGRIEKIEVGLPDLKNEIGMPPIQKPPSEVDYNMWLGPAPFKPYRGILHWHWRWQMDYSGGQLTDWCGHHVDIAFWSMQDKVSPVEIEGKGSFKRNSLFDVPYTFDIDIKLSNGIPMRITNTSKTSKGQGVTWYGEDGWIQVSRGKLDASNKDILGQKIPVNGIQLYHSDDHTQNFIDCVKSRKETIAPVHVANKAITTGLLGEIAILTGDKLKWDPVKEELINPGSEAKSLLKREYRKPWQFG